MSNQTDKKNYCIAEQLDTVCYHQSTKFCQLCKRNEDDRKRLLQEIGITRLVGFKLKEMENFLEKINE